MAAPNAEFKRFYPDYEYIGPLGEGGMGSVVLARNRKVGSLVALKMLRLEGFIQQQDIFAERLKREARILFEFDSPNIIKVLDLLAPNQAPAIVMEYIEGPTLAKLLRAERPRLVGGDQWPVRVSQVLVGVARALDYAHRRKIVHRDLKPSNVMIRAVDGMPKLCDFGIARTDVGAGPGLTKSGTSMGTVHYMSPEQIHADPNLDHRTDIYSFGVILYECITGDPPFRDKGSGSEFSVLHAHVMEPPPSLDGKTGPFDPRLALLANACLAKKPEDRPQTAREVVRELERLLPAEPEAGWPPVPPIAYTPHSASIVTEASTDLLVTPTPEQLASAETVEKERPSGTVAVPESVLKEATSKDRPVPPRRPAPAPVPIAPVQPLAAAPRRKSRFGLWLGLSTLALLAVAAGGLWYAHENDLIPQQALPAALRKRPAPAPQPTAIAALPSPTPNPASPAEPTPAATPLPMPTAAPTAAPAPQATPTPAPTPAPTATPAPTPEPTPTPVPFVPALAASINRDFLTEGDTATLTVRIEDPAAGGWTTLSPQVDVAILPQSTAALNVDFRLDAPEGARLGRSNPEITFDLETLRDDLQEPSETIRLLVTATGGAIVSGGEGGRFTVTIRDGEPATPLAASFDRAVLELAEGATARATLRLNRPAREELRLAVQAQELPERLSVPRQLVIPAGETEATIELRLDDDGVFEDFGAGGEIVLSGAVEARLPVRPRAAGGPPAVTVTGPATVPEGAGQIIFTIEAAPASAAPLIVGWRVQGEGAIGERLGAASLQGTVEIPAGQASARVPVPLVDNKHHEDNATVVLSLDPPKGAVLSGDARQRVTVVDDDPAPVARMGQPTAQGDSLFRFPVLLDGATRREARIDYRVTSSHEALVGVNYLATPPSPLVVPAGAGIGTIEVSILSHLPTSDWQLGITLVEGEGASVASGAPASTAAVAVRNPEVDRRNDAQALLARFWQAGRSPHSALSFEPSQMRRDLEAAFAAAATRDEKIDVQLALARLDFLEGNARAASIRLRENAIEALWLTSPRRTEVEQHVDFYSSLDAAGRGPVRPGVGEALPPMEIFAAEIDSWPSVVALAIRSTDRVAFLLDNGRDPWAVRVLRLKNGVAQPGKAPDTLVVDQAKAPNPLTVVLPPSDPEPVAIDFLEDDVIVLAPNGALARVADGSAQPGAWVLLGVGEKIDFIDLAATEAPGQLYLLADDRNTRSAALYVVEHRGGAFTLFNRVDLPQDLVDDPTHLAFGGNGNLFILEKHGVSVFNEVTRQTKRALEASSLRGLAADRINGAYTIDRSRDVLSYPHAFLEPITTLDFDGRGEAGLLDSDEYGNLLIHGKRNGRTAIMIHGRFDPAVHLAP